jgi:cyclic pyranopterin phosphate synthase
MGRPLRDLRISVTDRCNFRCSYCMPREHFGSDHEFLPKHMIISYEEIIVVVKSMLPLGLKKVRITGGEPLMRKDISKLISMIRKLDSDLDIAMTTNGVLLRRHITSLKEAGLNRVTVSLDSIDEQSFKEITDSENDVSQVIDGINSVIELGMEVKVNTVIKRGVNENQIIPLVNTFLKLNVPIRFIEFMDVGSTNSWNLDSVVTGKEIREIIGRNFNPLIKKKSNYFGEVAKLWTMDGDYDIGFIESISSPFCGSCTRARISSKGNLYTCLFSEQGYDLLSIIRMNAEVADVTKIISSIWNKRDDKYSEYRSENNSNRKPVEMSYIGG